MIVAALTFIRNVTATTTVSEVTEEYLEDGRVHILQDKDIPSYVSILRIHGPFLFGSTEKMDEIIARVDTLQPIVLLRLRNMTALDATGMKAIENLADALHATGRQMIVCGARKQPAELMHDAEFQEHVGEKNISPNVQAALVRARELYGAKPEIEQKVRWKRRKSDREEPAEAATQG
jgi:SulP family sulfate permease